MRVVWSVVTLPREVGGDDECDTTRAIQRDSPPETPVHSPFERQISPDDRIFRCGSVLPSHFVVVAVVVAARHNRLVMGYATHRTRWYHNWHMSCKSTGKYHVI